MNSNPTSIEELTAVKKQRPFRKAVLRGLGVLMPPLLTVVLFLWAWNIIVSYVLEPIEDTILTVCMMRADIRDDIPDGAAAIRIDPNGSGRDIVRPVTDEQADSNSETDVAISRDELMHEEGFFFEGVVYVPVKSKFIPKQVYDLVEANPGQVEPTTPHAIFRRYFELRYLQRHFTVPVFLLVFVATLYLLGKFLAAGVGRMIWNGIERMVNRLPLVSNVYSSVKQVTDFAFSQTELQYTRVVAVQYPRKGVWSMGFVTGEGMLDVRMAANEPVMTILMPTSPMPATGFTITVPKSETIDLNITIDQAIQFCVSCGVVVPSHQQQHHLDNKTDATPENLFPPSKLMIPSQDDNGSPASPDENTPASDAADQTSTGTVESDSSKPDDSA